MSTAVNILVVDDEPEMRRYLRQVLELDAHHVTAVDSGSSALEQLQRGFDPDVVLLDMLMPEMDGLQTLERMRKMRPSLRVVMLSCEAETPKVVQAMRLGATDYWRKPFRKEELNAILEQCHRDRKAEVHAQTPPPHIEELGDGQFFLAATPTMRQLRMQAGLVANIDVPVLVLGESGVGKEVIAKLIHNLSARAHRTFMKVNCAAVPADLLESELFGYEPGAFTGASRPKPGKFELCHKGTILLDEIGEMPAALQAKLLHVLQDQEFSRLGGRSSIKVDVRIIAATNIDIHAAIAEKRFREDLYYRLNALVFKVPPLRERREEIPHLLKHMMLRMAQRYGRNTPTLPRRLVDACMHYGWPGNLREMGNFLKRYLVLGNEESAVAELEQAISEKRPAAAAASVPAPTPSNDLKSMVRSLKDEAEREAIIRVLQQTNWNRKEAALLLNISYKALLYKVRQYGIAPQSGRVPTMLRNAMILLLAIGGTLGGAARPAARGAVCHNRRSVRTTSAQARKSEMSLVA